MIDRLLQAVRKKGGGAADALWQRHERTAISFESGRLKSAATSMLRQTSPVMRSSAANSRSTLKRWNRRLVPWCPPAHRP